MSAPAGLPSCCLLLIVLPLAASVPACGVVESAPTPHLVPGGGIGDGAISGLLNVYVTDEDTRAPVTNASVRVGAAAAVIPCTVQTDMTGLAVFDARTCPALKGKQDLTASAAGYVPNTWIGVNGTNLTITIRATTRVPVDSAVVTGTIAGWDALPAPATGHQTLGIVGFSQTRVLGDRANDIPQGTRVLTVPVVGTVNVLASACVRNAAINDCNWRLTTRTGAQAHYALVVDQDSKGTPNDDSDDTLTIIGWAVKTGLTFVAGQ